MKGITNAVVLQGGGGGGETVFAVNNTGAAVTKGTKALLNSHQRETTATAEKLINSTSASVMYFPFCKGKAGSGRSMMYGNQNA